jgi:CubicO group peptidase (beta-lactamase class C family)
VEPTAGSTLNKVVLEKAAAIIEAGIKARLHLGAQLYVSRDGNPVGDLAFGEAREGVAMRPGTLMLWMSSIKPITAVAIAQWASSISTTPSRGTSPSSRPRARSA